MKKIWIIVMTAIALLTAGQVFASKVTNVELSCADGATLASINVDGAFRFTHQTEEAKDGKPFRIIVDVLSARHGLGAYTFTELPTCPIVGIRSSQYSVAPEEVVRIVFDMDNERVYRVDADNKRITIVIPDKEAPKFAAWSTVSLLTSQEKPTAPVVASPKAGSPAAVASATESKQKSAQELNKSIDQDRLASLQDNKSTTAEPKKPPVATVAPVVKAEAKPTPVIAQKPQAPTETKPVVKQEVPVARPTRTLTRVSDSGESYGGPVYTPSVPASEKSPVVAQAEKPVTTPKAVEKPVVAQAEKPVTVQKVAENPVAVKNAEPTKTEPTKAVASLPKAESLTAVEPAEPKGDKKTAETAEVVVNDNAASEAPVAVVEDDDSDEVDENELKAGEKEADPADKKSATSRFRRSPTESKKIKGTLVAEFPKRLVIKYKSSGWRDPFLTLIDETKTDNNPVERRVPNVEGLKLVGIIEAGVESNRALFEDKDGYGYILQTGDKVQKGYVLRVESDRVYFQIFEYGWSRTVALNLES